MPIESKIFSGFSNYVPFLRMLSTMNLEICFKVQVCNWAQDNMEISCISVQEKWLHTYIYVESWK